jgi:hypothetical protein
MLTADLVHYSTNMPKPLKNLYNEPLKKARGRFVGIALRAQTVCAAAVEFTPSEAWGPRRTVNERRLTLHSHFGSILCAMAMKKLSNPPIII